jgi:alkylation response protein AidB-like acyl-CoA dehydrogenase
MCKFLATTVAEATASKCINWMGGNGITEQVQKRRTESCFSRFHSRVLNHSCIRVLQYMAEKYYRDAKVFFPQRVRHKRALTLGQVGQIYEGTSNIQLQTIANILQQEYKTS